MLRHIFWNRLLPDWLRPDHVTFNQSQHSPPPPKKKKTGIVVHANRIWNLMQSCVVICDWAVARPRDRPATNGNVGIFLFFVLSEWNACRMSACAAIRYLIWKWLEHAGTSCEGALLFILLDQAGGGRGVVTLPAVCVCGSLERNVRRAANTPLSCDPHPSREERERDGEGMIRVHDTYWYQIDVPCSGPPWFQLLLMQLTPTWSKSCPTLSDSIKVIQITLNRIK